MVRSCCVQGCSNKSHDGKGRRVNPGSRFFSFPAWKRNQGPLVEEITQRRRMAWVSAVRRKDITFSQISPFMYVCSRHFHKGQPAYEMMETDPDWAPSLLLGHTETKPSNPERSDRKRKRKQPIKNTSKPESRTRHPEQLQQETGDRGQLNIITVKTEPEESVQEEWEFETAEGRLLDITVIQREADESVQEDANGWTYENAGESAVTKTLDATEVVKCEDEEEEIDQHCLGIEVDKQEPEERVQINMANHEVPQTACDKSGVLRCDEINQLLDKNKVLFEPEGCIQVSTSINELTRSECRKCVLRFDEINRLLDENRALRRELSEYKISDGFFGNDGDDKVQYYTGLPNLATFMTLFNFLVPLITDKKVLTPFQKLLLTFMRLKLDLPMQHLAHLFRVSHRTVYRTFSDMVTFMCANLRPSIAWPDRDTLRKTMPGPFVEVFGNQAVVIVDCFEISSEKPSDLKARSEMFSSAKNAHTMKYLMGITPNGSVCFLSKGWGGRTNDSHLIESSGLLDFLMPGDIVLSSRGFGLQEGTGMMFAEVKPPPNVNDSGQLAVRSVEETRRIEHLKIHVEKVMKNVCQKYKILSGPISFNMILPCAGEEDTFLDKVVTVCCALTNRCPTVA
ncbi:uncharacterized protein LOC103021414 [Astyanax mexicanus]|uniref:uncharacterized protein LOC103021414 n=1 Tax=Astyanax mexicanus TaxID=7994 RepID=UPI0020CAA33B|nr:uncharacterized protein LOC103021414 [Astyanax mexicanus]